MTAPGRCCTSMRTVATTGIFKASGEGSGAHNEVSKATGWEIDREEWTIDGKDQSCHRGESGIGLGVRRVPFFLECNPKKGTLKPPPSHI